MAEVLDDGTVLKALYRDVRGLGSWVLDTSRLLVSSPETEEQSNAAAMIPGFRMNLLGGPDPVPQHDVWNYLANILLREVLKRGIP